jgi:8-oxo-dGTP pyrophosphatase MutT (NUDIX family)
MRKKNNTPTKPRPASTVVLARDHHGELQVYLLKRSTRSGFFPGVYVFPGGEVDSDDRIESVWRPHLDVACDEISQRLGGEMPEHEVITRVVAAIRETFEEAGVLLCHHSKPGQGDFEGLCARRIDPGLPKGWLKDLVESEGWTLEFSRLTRWAHWITPELMPRRYETRFFIAFMPPGQECVPDSMETTDGIWVSPLKGLEGNLQGETPLSPPTLITLHQLLQYWDVGDLREDTKARPWGDALLPRMIPLTRGSIILEPWDPMYDEEVAIDERALESAILPLEESFSRVWYHEGIWRPVGAGYP